ncbi:MAG: spermidine synthase [Brachymonas sp.]|nr:spermidine synthase [Brachymonas sp.]
MPPATALPEVQISEDRDSRYLHLDSPWVQGAMRLKDPLLLDLEYIQRMMAWLLFVEPATVADRHAMQLGLGAASLTKFTSKKLGMLTTCVELNPAVYRACRQWFRLPDNHAQLNVLLGDAGVEIAKPEWRNAIDALQVDLYDHEAAAPVLDDADFYRACRDALTPEGCMTVNLFGRNSSFARSVEQIAQAFGEEALWAFKPTREGNTVVLAQRTPSRPPRPLLEARADVIQQRWGLPAGKWLRVFKPLCVELGTIEKQP